MATLVIDGTTFPVRAGQIPKRVEDTAAYRRRWLGSLDMEVRGPFARVRVWTPTSKLITRVQADAIQAVVLAAGTRTVTGDVGSATCYSRIVDRSEPRYDQVQLVIELAEVGS